MYNIVLLLSLLVGTMHHTQPETIEVNFEEYTLYKDVSQEKAGRCEREFRGNFLDGRERRVESGWHCSLKDGNSTLEWVMSCTPPRVTEMLETKPTMHAQEILSVLKLVYDKMYYELQTRRARFVQEGSDISVGRAIGVVDFLMRDVEKALDAKIPKENKMARVCLHKWVWADGPLSSVMKNAP
jgi:hypothetical protein